ncbi:M56 family metallopeptidase [Flavobacterium sp. ASW18X]|uniref:M56 family metallopeptidase n=1 Tax=Flavobacterium sp. ASW18X TaxID=2572595 RepID=UPI001F118688|nr:M56 family metallopeptidase [Flavobacterium sp. ASW18X]
MEHELVHIKQWHSLDLFFFELMRIAFWFNPLVYVYQNRVSELHEFIADAKVAKHHKKQQYAILLSQAFKTENISFINQFFTQSLIKKRIVMLSKQKSKRIFQLKYILLMPLVLGMLVYTSCEQSIDNQEEKIEPVSINKVLTKTDSIITTTAVPFSVIDQVPVFPGCESAADKRACFQENIQNHIRKHFNYPLEAQEQNIQGRVAIMFTIQEDGTIGNIEKRGPHALLENEAVRIIERLPKMEPGKHKGKVVSVPFSIPITFRLQEEHGIDNAIAQFSKRDANWIPFMEIENPPVFPGCEDAADARACFNENIINHIKKHFNYPQEAKEKGIQGRVAIRFVINTKGEIIDIQKRGPSPILEAEAERIIKRLPKMQPASNNGELADVAYSIPITFKL